MSAKSLEQPMPRWVRNALKAGVMSLREAKVLQGAHQMMAEIDLDFLPLPEWMHPSCSRLSLFEMQAASKRRN